MKLYFFILLLFPDLSFASPAEERETLSDRTHQRLSRGIYIFSNRLDNFFGADRGDDESNQSRVRTFAETRMGENRMPINDFRVKANIVLPHLQEMFRFDFNKDNKKKDNEPHSTERKIDYRTEEQKRLDHLAEKKHKTEVWNMYADTGIDARIPLTPFIRTRFRRSYYFDFWEFRPTEEIFWYDRLGVGSQTSLTLDHPYSEKVLLRMEQTATWKETDQILRLRLGPTLFHEVDERRALAYSVFINGMDKPYFVNTDYEINIKLRQLLYKRWFFFEMKPEAHFPRSDHFALDTFFTFRLEAVFGMI